MDLSTVRHLQAIRKAEAEVAPYVGSVMGMDSAGAVYKAALERLGHDIKGIPLDQTEGIFRAIKATPARRMATDRAAAKAYAERFPDANRLRFNR